MTDVLQQVTESGFKDVLLQDGYDCKRPRLGDEVNVQVLRPNHERNRIALSADSLRKSLPQSVKVSGPVSLKKDDL